MILAEPILKSIPALDIPELAFESGLVRLPMYVTISNVRYKLNLPKLTGSYITNGEEILVHPRLVSALDIKYEVDQDAVSKELVIMEMSNDLDDEEILDLDIYPGDKEVELASIPVIKKALEEFGELSERILGKKISHKLSPTERYYEIIDRVWGCLKEDKFKGHIPVSAYISALTSSAKDIKLIERIGNFFEKFKEFRFYSQIYGEASIFETNILRLYLRTLMIVLGEFFVYDVLDGGIQEELIDYIKRGKISIIVNVKGDSKEYSTKEDFQELAELFKVDVTEDGFVEVASLNDITFEKLIVTYSDGAVLEITEEAQLNLGDKLPIIARVVEGINVLSPNLIDSKTTFTALSETNLKPDIKRIGKFTKGDEHRPIYSEMFMPMDYRGIGKILSPIPARIGLDLVSVDINKDTIERSKAERKEDLVRLFEEKPSYRRTRKILDITSSLVEKNILLISNIDSMFSPKYRKYIDEYIKSNGFILAPLGYNFSAQLLTHLKTSGIRAHGRIHNIQSARPIRNALYSALNGITLNTENPIKKLSEVIVGTLSGKELKAVVTPDIKREEIVEIIHDKQGVAISYEFSLGEGYFVWNLPNESFIPSSRGGMIVMYDGVDATIIPILLDITDTHTPRPTVGLEYIDSMYNVVYGLVEAKRDSPIDVTIMPAIVLSGKLIENQDNLNIEFARTANEDFVRYLLKVSESDELVETSPYIHQNGVMLYTEKGWIQAIGNKFIEKCRCKQHG